MKLRFEASLPVLAMKGSAVSSWRCGMGRLSSSEFRRVESRAAHRATFEETWPRYEFAELVRLALAAGAWLVKVRRLARRQARISSESLPGEIKPAE